jgi:hypothetical protein
MSPADKRYLDVNRRRDKISRRYARELTEEIYKANLKYIKGADLSNLENVIYPINYPSTDVEKLVEDLYFDAGYLFSDQFVKDFAQGKFKSDLSEGIPKVQWKTEAIGKYFRSNLNQIKTISLTSEIGAQRLLNSVVYDAIQDGKGIRAVTDALKNDKFLRNLKRTSRFQAERIARTETLSAASYGEYLGSQELFQKYGVTMGKYWIAKKDSRTRNSHNEMKRSETIGAEEDFEVGGSKMQFPGDRRGGPSQVINCRCALGWRRIEEETPAPPPPQANIPTPIIPEDVKPTGFGVSEEVNNSLGKLFKWYKSKRIKVPDIDERFKKLLSIAPKKSNRKGNLFGINKITHDSKKGSYYSPIENTVNIADPDRIRRTNRGNARIIYHEYGHAIHERQNIIRHRSFNDADPNSNFLKLFSKLESKGYKSGLSRAEREAFIKRKKYFDEVEDKFKETRVYWRREQLLRNTPDSKVGEFFEERMGLKKGSLKGMNKEDIVEAFGGYADTMQALSGDGMGYGHSRAYMMKDINRQAEFFAHSMENRFLGNPIFEHFDKSLYDEMVKMVDEILEENGI